MRGWCRLWHLASLQSETAVDETRQTETDADDTVEGDEVAPESDVEEMVRILWVVC